MTTEIKKLFKNKKLWEQAIQPAHGRHAATYERLEFLGDRVLGLIIAEMLYNAFPDEKEGALAKRFVVLTCEETLAEIAHLWGLNKLIKTTNTELKENDSILSDVCEAVLGSLYLDQDLGTVKKLVIPTWTPLMESNTQAPQDPKSACQEWAQAHFKTLPSYTVLEQSGTESDPVFKIQVCVQKMTAIGFGRNKKSAQKDAAKNLLEKYNV